MKKVVIIFVCLVFTGLIFSQNVVTVHPSIVVSDVDGNVYQTVTIGTQIWMQENLKTTKYNDGKTIPNVTDNTAWVNLGNSSSPGYCWYNNDYVDYGSTYGALYNWYAVNTGKLCPTGWHVPSHDEWTTLERAVCSSSTCATDFPYDNTTGWQGTDEGGKLKEAGTAHWLSPNTGATNSSGFSALPGGYRDSHHDGAFYDIGYYGYWWAATEYGSGSAWSRNLGCNYAGVNRYYGYGGDGFSVRCLRD